MGLPEIIAHRGARNEAPENTVLSVEIALKITGISGVEFDVALSDRPIVIHQETLVPDSTFTALEAVGRDMDSRDWVSRYTTDEITTLDVGSHFDSKFSGLRVPELHEIFACDWKGKQAFMELKDAAHRSSIPSDRPARMVAAVKPEVEKFTGRIRVLSFSPDVLKAMRRGLPEIPRMLLLWMDWQDCPEKAVDAAFDVEVDTVIMADVMVIEKPDWIERLHASGLRIFVYPVTPARGEPEYFNWTPKIRRPVWDKLIALQVDGIVTDFPRELMDHILG